MQAGRPAGRQDARALNRLVPRYFTRPAGRVGLTRWWLCGSHAAAHSPARLQRLEQGAHGAHATRVASRCVRLPAVWHGGLAKSGPAGPSPGPSPGRGAAWPWPGRRAACGAQPVNQAAPRHSRPHFGPRGSVRVGSVQVGGTRTPAAGPPPAAADRMGAGAVRVQGTGFGPEDLPHPAPPGSVRSAPPRLHRQAEGCPPACIASSKAKDRGEHAPHHADRNRTVAPQSIFVPICMMSDAQVLAPAHPSSVNCKVTKCCG